MRAASRRTSLKPVDPPRSPPPLYWCTWRNQRRRCALSCRRPPSAIGPPFALPGCPPGPMWAPFLAPHLAPRLAPRSVCPLYLPYHPHVSRSILRPCPISPPLSPLLPHPRRRPCLRLTYRGQTPPLGNVLPTVEVVKRKPCYPSHKEVAVQVKGADLLLVLVHMYPLCIGE